MKISFSKVLGTAVLTAGVGLAVSAQADQRTFFINSGLSSLTLGGAAFGLSYGAQSAGSTTAFFSGTINADVTGGVLNFTGGSVITALANPGGPYSSTPAPYPTGGDNFGVKAGPGFVTGYGLVTVNGVYRSLTLDVTGSASDASAPSGLTFTFTGGRLDWGATTGLGPAGGSGSLVSVSGLDTALSNFTFDGTTLTIPVQLHTTGSNRYEDWAGTMVAVIPEPSTLSLGLLGMGAGLAFRRNRRSKSSQ
ncbi:MAG: PEP-CTERM sorting domain-containing protein [Verrucomicrobia bacterium]|jgi:hypothetical protein|nr:PEP-CTERM sorting domain-containing protein [Verrucomicrobiota bacterium]